MLAVNTLLSGVAFSMMTFTVATVLLEPVDRRRAHWASPSPPLIGVLGGLGPAWRAAHLRGRRRPPARLMATAPDELRENLKALRLERAGAPARPRRRLRWVLIGVALLARRGSGGAAHRRRPRADGAGRDRHA